MLNKYNVSGYMKKKLILTLIVVMTVSSFAPVMAIEPIEQMVQPEPVGATVAEKESFWTKLISKLPQN